MRRLLVLLSAIAVITIFVSSPLLAARPSLEHRIQYLSAVFCRNAFLLAGSFYRAGYVGVVLEGGRGYILGGDADDLANGRGDGTIIPIEPKTPTRAFRDEGMREPDLPELGTIISKP